MARARFAALIISMVGLCRLGAVPAAASGPVGLLPASRYPIAVPNVDVAHDRIVDGTRRVNIAGLQGTVTQLWKVDGGYVIGRKTPRGHRSQGRTGEDDLVYVATDGTRRVITSYWAGPEMVVARSGSQIVFNTQAWSQIWGTHVYSLATGTMTAFRQFPGTPHLLGFADGRVLLSERGQRCRRVVGPVARHAHAPRSTTPTTNGRTCRPRQPISTAGQYAVHGIDTVTGRRASRRRPTRTGPSPGDSWGPGPRTTPRPCPAGRSPCRGGFDPDVRTVHRAADGHQLLRMVMPSSEPSVWETDSTVLFVRRSLAGTSNQVVRCTLSGHCATVGPTGATRWTPVRLGNPPNQLTGTPERSTGTAVSAGRLRTPTPHGEQCFGSSLHANTTTTTAAQGPVARPQGRSRAHRATSTCRKMHSKAAAKRKTPDVHRPSFASRWSSPGRTMATTMLLHRDFRVEHLIVGDDGRLLRLRVDDPAVDLAFLHAELG